MAHLISMRESPKMAFPPNSILREERPLKMHECGQALLRDWPPCPPIQRGDGERSRPGVSPFISALTVFRWPATFPRVRPHIWSRCPELWDFLPHRTGTEDEERGLSYTPCLLPKPALCFRLPSPKQSPVFLPLQIPLPSPVATAFSRQRRQSV